MEHERVRWRRKDQLRRVGGEKRMKREGTRLGQYKEERREEGRGKRRK